MSDMVVSISADGLDPEQLFKLLPRRLPARVKSTRGRNYGVVHLLIPAVYPDGERINDIECTNLNRNIANDDVLVEWEEVPENKRGGRPYLIQGVDALRTRPGEIEQEIRRFEEYIGAQIQEKLREAVDALRKEREIVAASVDEQVSQRLAERTAKLTVYESVLDLRNRKLDEQEKTILQRERSLEHTVATLVGKQLTDRSFELDQRDSLLRESEARHEADIMRLRSEQDSLQAKWAKLTAERARFETEGGQKFIEYLTAVDLENQEKAPQRIDASDEPFDPQTLASSLAKSSYYIEPDVLAQATVASLSAWAGGQFVILSGPTGVGKTYLVRALSEILGMGYGLIPVRPSWVEPADLLGFYNPMHKLFEPAPALDRLIRAKRFTEADRLYALCFDEMNLARVENYAADLLSKLEASGKDREVDLYSEDIARRLICESERYLQKQNELEPGEAAYLGALLRQLKEYTPHFPLPRGLVVYGTVNVDETIQMFSPKFLDRAYVLRIPCVPNLDSSNQPLGMASIPFPTWRVTLEKAEQLADLSVASGKIDGYWRTFMDWQSKYLAPLELHFGHRFRNNLRRYVAIGLNLGLSDATQLVEDYFLAKILPRVSFNLDERALGKVDITKIDLIQEWIDRDRPLRSYKKLHSRLSEMVERGVARGIVEFWD